MKSIRPDEFFKLLALNSGADLQTAKDVYYGLIKTISRELKGKQVIKLPDWGEFSLKIFKAKKMVNIKDKAFIQIPAKTIVKFVSDYKVKKYFHDFGKE